MARQQGRQWLFDRYQRVLDRLRHRAPHAIPYGTYFERMIAFVGVKKGQTKTVNQLDHILSIWDRAQANGRRPRLSALQVSCLDPAKDHTGQPVRGFPCLQQVSFVYDHDGGLAVNAYYPSQYIFDRGYGNYLGLCRLGEFMAYEMDLNLVRLNCYVNAPIRGDITRAALTSLEATAQDVLNQDSTAIENFMKDEATNVEAHNAEAWQIDCLRRPGRCRQV